MLHLFHSNQSCAYYQVYVNVSFSRTFILMALKLKCLNLMNEICQFGRFYLRTYNKSIFCAFSVMEFCILYWKLAHNSTWDGRPENKSKNGIQGKYSYIFNVFSAGSMNSTFLKAGKNQKYIFSTETFKLDEPKYPNFSTILQHVLDLKLLQSLINKQTLFYHSLWNTLYEKCVEKCCTMLFLHF